MTDVNANARRRDAPVSRSGTASLAREPVRTWELAALLALLTVGVALRVAYINDYRALPDFDWPMADPLAYDCMARH